MGVYLPTAPDNGCTVAQFTETWQHTVTHIADPPSGDGWDLLLLWAGLQSQTADVTGSRFSNTPTLAFQEGADTATVAYHEAEHLGFTGGVLYFDLEYFAFGTSTSMTAAKEFMTGWETFLANHTAFRGGVYANTTAIYELGPISTHPNRNYPQAIYVADWDGSPGLATLTPIPNGWWIDKQRTKQYEGPHSQKYGTIPMIIDSDCADGPMNGAYNWTDPC